MSTVENQQDQDQELQEDQVPELQEEKTIFLRKPVKVGGVTYDKCELREPEAGELDKASRAQTQVGVAINLISLVAKLPVVVVSKFSQRDLREAADFLGTFSGDVPATTETSLPS